LSAQEKRISISLILAFYVFAANRPGYMRKIIAKARKIKKNKTALVLILQRRHYKITML